MRAALGSLNKDRRLSRSCVDLADSGRCSTIGALIVARTVFLFGEEMALISKADLGTTLGTGTAVRTGTSLRTGTCSCLWMEGILPKAVGLLSKSASGKEDGDA